MNEVIIATCVGFVLGLIVALLLSDAGTKGISRYEYTTKDGLSHTAKRERGDHIV